MKNSNIKGWYKSNKLPHFDCDKVYQFITFRLYDSVPREVIIKWKSELDIADKTKSDSKEANELQQKIMKFEDKGFGECFLKNKQVYDIVAKSILFFDKIRYNVIEWCIMPNHVHILIKPIEGNSLPEIMHSLKSFTANKANKILNRKGKFWMRDYFDRYIRNDNHFQAVIEYIRRNGKCKQDAYNPEVK